MTQWLRGVDPGLANTGIADLTFDDGDLVDLRTELVKSEGRAHATDDQVADRMTRMVRRVVPAGEARTCSHGTTHYDAPDITMLMIEGPVPGTDQRGAHEGAGFYWAVRRLALARGITVGMCRPVHLKTWATGRGNAVKAQMRTALERMWPGLMIRTDHEIDAALLALAGAQYLGWHQRGEPLRQAAELAKMSWPRQLERTAR